MNYTIIFPPKENNFAAFFVSKKSASALSSPKSLRLPGHLQESRPEHPDSKVSFKLSVYDTAIRPVTVTTARIANKSVFLNGELRFCSETFHL